MGNSGSSGSSSSRKARSLPNSPEAHRLPSPYNKQSSGVGGAGGGPGGGTSIPLPATVAATRRCPPDKVRPAPAPTHQSQLGGLKHGNGGVGSASSSRSTSPSQQQPSQGGLSFIPQPRSQNTNRQPTATTPSPRASTVGRPNGGLRPQQQALPYSGNTVPPPQPNKNSVLDKFKLFNNKDKNQERGKTSSGVSKRTSSSSGFSSARSEHSDSSTSLCDQSKVQAQESPKSRALKSKLQSAKPAKQASPKTGRKEQSKAQSKIARTSKGPPSSSEKLTTSYNNPIVEQDVKIASKTIGTKLPSDRKTPTLQELQVKQPVMQPPKLNPPALTSPKQINLQDTKNVSLKNELPTTKLSPRPKMELPGKIPDSRIYLQSMKPPPNGLNKDFMMQKAILANTNGIIKPSELGETLVHENDTFNHTLSMNQANLSDGKDLMTKQRQPGVLEVNHEQHSGMECLDSPSKTRVSNQEKVICEEEAESIDVSNDKQDAVTINRADSVAHEKLTNAEDELMSVPTQSNLSFGPGKPLAGSNSPLHGPNPAGLSPGSSIPKPTALVKGTSKPSKENGTISGVPTPTKPKSGDALHRKLDPNTVAMVSPMPSISDLMSESSHSNSNSTGQSNSSDSSVIYRPSSESGSEIKTIPNRKIDTFEQMEKVLSESSTCGGTLADDEAEMTVKPMQPLLRGYTPGARGLQTLPSRATARQYTVLHSSSHHHVGGHHDYADVDVASGYLSDGEVLRGGGISVGSRTLSDLCDGYMSEGGASLYARRINPSYGHDHDSFQPAC
ncbi:PREDICTED: protein sickie-like isoform X2 [Vollenhovia emeryi]|uniref:protein sickie-like isoform X2 n=1 Tax=Vollenhovia emeryi TaxID=411798 RepID=UPI0005F4B3F2|nr:PREDICTED: protein sickie-like isoform X2 [Vollenhovia emeryi]